MGENEERGMKAGSPDRCLRLRLGVRESFHIWKPKSAGSSRTFQVKCWDRGRPRPQTRHRREVSFGRPYSFSRFALIAGGTPAVPAHRLTSSQEEITHSRPN